MARSADATDANCPPRPFAAAFAASCSRFARIFCWNTSRSASASSSASRAARSRSRSFCARRAAILEISASRFPPRIARFLGYEVSDPALLIIRSFRNPAGKLLEVAVSFYPPYEFRYVTRLSRSDGRHKARI